MSPMSPMNMNRRPIVAVLLAVPLAGLLAAGCGSSSASSSTSTSTTSAAPAASVTPREWLTANAAHWSGRLNGDQQNVNAAADASKGVSPSTYFGRLTPRCAKLRDDVQKAMSAPKAPTTSLQSAWDGMLSATASYASKCTKLTPSSSTSDVNAWQNSLSTMNAANNNFNQVADAAAKASSSTTTTTTASSSH
jgi:hypothetical protein